MERFSFSVISFFAAISAMSKVVKSACSRLYLIRSDESELTPENWCELQPCAKIKLASKEIILTQPTSTFLVYALGLQTTGTGLYFLHISGSEISRLWWGISLVLWGIGALLAGTSYQGFAYEIKCAGRQSCTWTSWWEVIYLMFQQVSMATMLVAVAYSCTEGLLLKMLLIYALISGVLYVGSTFIGAFFPIKSLLTFNFMVWI
ncbi:MAG: hypothetical protein QNK24_11815, partial [Desulfuromusa sp.]|nr:hypothetical protein [Desulfuromusa sp.]